MLRIHNTRVRSSNNRVVPVVSMDTGSLATKWLQSNHVQFDGSGKTNSTRKSPRSLTAWFENRKDRIGKCISKKCA